MSRIKVEWFKFDQPGKWLEFDQPVDPFKTDQASVNLCDQSQMMSTCLAADDEKKQHTCRYRQPSSRGTKCCHLRFREFCDSVAAQYEKEVT